jgi:dTDP-4-amino-4,6-dideoxygalactose transaminase
LERLNSEGFIAINKDKIRIEFFCTFASFNHLARLIQMDNKKLITVTSPLLPPLDEFIPYLEEIWSSKWITNNGQFHRQLEAALAEYLGVKYVSLFTNGTLPLITALQAMNITGEVITTPYSFVATTHALWWNGIKPVFVDIDPNTCNLDPDKIEAAITEKTTAIMPVHCYGIPCDTKKIQAIADKYGLKVIYDAAHAFGVQVNGESVLKAGDMSTLSFHATKVFNTVEGGALICHDAETKKQIDFLKNFGFNGETEVVAPGINSKMDEIRSAYGLLNLKQVDAAIEARHKVADYYRQALRQVRGVKVFEDTPGVRHNYSYFPILIDAEEYGMTRDELYFKMRDDNVLGRRYFYPLISTFDTYKNLESATPDNLPVATRIADEVICLPMYYGLTEEDLERVVGGIVK